MKVKEILAMSSALFFVLIFASQALAFSMTAGPVMIVADVGGTNTSSFGLLNSGNATITMNIRAEGDAAQFIQVPSTLDLIPNKLTYVSVTATIPVSYDGSLGGNITGFVYAVQEGSPGQVQINIQAQKLVQILVPKFGGVLPQTSTSTQVSSQSSGEQGNSISGLTSLTQGNSLFILTGFGILIIGVFVIIMSRFEISVKSRG
jgi:hypothetical protein